MLPSFAFGFLMAFTVLLIISFTKWAKQRWQTKYNIKIICEDLLCRLERNKQVISDCSRKIAECSDGWSIATWMSVMRIDISSEEAFALRAAGRFFSGKMSKEISDIIWDIRNYNTIYDEICRELGEGNIYGARQLLEFLTEEGGNIMVKSRNLIRRHYRNTFSDARALPH